MTKQSKIESNYCQLFIDSGDGFSEKKSIRAAVAIGENKVTFDLSAYKDIKTLRFDPLDNYTIFRPLKFIAVTKDKKLDCEFSQINGKYMSSDKTEIIFDNNDPNIILEDIEESIKSIEINFHIESPLITLEQLNGMLKNDIQTLKDQRALDKAELLKQAQDFSPMSEKLLKSINGKLNLQVAEIDYLKSLFAQFKNIQQKLQKTLETVNPDSLEAGDSAKIFVLKKALKETELKLEKKNNSIEQLKTDLLILKEQKATKDEFEVALSKTMDAHINRMKTLQSESLSSLTDNEVKEINLRNKELNTLIIQYKEQIEILKQNEAELKEEIGKLHNSNQEKFAQLEVEKERNKGLKEDLKKELTKINSVESDLQRLQTKFDNLKKEFNALTKIEAKHYRLIEELSLISSHL